MASSITIKGLKKGLLFVFTPENTVEDYIADLELKAAENPLLLTGAAVRFDYTSLAHLAAEDLLKLQRACLEHGLLLQNAYEPDKPKKAAEKAKPAPQLSPASSDVAVYKTLRSGQKVNCTGTVVIYGNVNESAEITAGGDVIVLGRLEGIIHAGCYGDESSIIFALDLAPNQLRIGSHISRSGKVVFDNRLDHPGSEPATAKYPEIAYLEKDQICIKPYNLRDFVR